MRPLHRAGQALALTLLVSAWGAPAATGQDASPPAPRLILISWDGAADWVVDRLLAEGRLPNLQTLRDRGGSADHSLPSFPSKTAVSHAALWTGCWPGCNGVTGNRVLVEPRAEHTLLETRRGFSSEALLAEPLFVTAAKAGKKVVVLSATQSFPVQPHVENLRASGASTENLLIFSGFEQEIADGLLLDASALGPAEGWRRPAADHPGPRLELTTVIGETTLHGLIYDDPADPVDGFDTLSIYFSKDDGGPVATLKPRKASVEALGWSPPLVVRDGDLEGFAFFRLFDLAPDGSRLALYRRAVHALRGAHDRQQLGAYLEAYPGFHDDAFWRYRRGALGPKLVNGGDGTAEERLLEIVAHDVELLKRGTRFVLAAWQPDLLWHYSPMTDSAGHNWIGILDPSSPAHDPDLATRIWPHYAKVFELLDGWLGDVMQHAPPETILALVTDHGMVGTAHNVYVNTILAEAGLLYREDGAIDLARTRILASDSSFFLRVNERGFPGGAVPPGERASVIEAARRALLAARDPTNGRRLIDRVWQAEDFCELGLEGPRQGDLYLDTAPGYYPVTGVSGHVVHSQGPGGAGNHGFWPGRREVQAIFYLAGPGVRPGASVPSIRQIDVAPTLSHLLGIPAPPQATGRVIVELLAGQAR